MDIFDIILNLFLGILHDVTNTIKNSPIILFLKKNIKIIKIIFYLGLLVNVGYKIYFLDIKTEQVNLNLKLFGYILNFILILYTIFKPSKIIKKPKLN